MQSKKRELGCTSFETTWKGTHSVLYPERKRKWKLRMPSRHLLPRSPDTLPLLKASTQTSQFPLSSLRFRKEKTRQYDRSVFRGADIMSEEGSFLIGETWKGSTARECELDATPNAWMSFRPICRNILQICGILWDLSERFLVFL